MLTSPNAGAGARARSHLQVPAGARRAPRPTESRALGVVAFGAVALLCWMVSSVAFGIVLGALLAFAISPWHRRLVRRKRSPALAALGCTSAVTLSVGAALAGLGY